MRSIFLCFLCGFVILIQSCKDSKENTVVAEDKTITTPKTPEQKKFSSRDLERMYGVTLSKNGDTLPPMIHRDSAVDMLLTYGKKNPETVVRMTTKYGNIDIELYTDTPVERANFIFLIKNKFFSHSVVHRTVKDFVVQAGNSDDRMMALKRSAAGNYKLPANYLSKYKHERGTLSLAKNWENNPTDEHNPFEFFITLKKSQHLDSKHTIFGKVISGMDVADKISLVETYEDDWPKVEIPITMKVLR